MDRTERTELTMLCLVCDGDRILLQNRIRPDWCGYTLPGGHYEPGESFVEGAVREVREETGLTVSNLQLCGIKQFPKDGYRYIVLLFRTDTWTGTLTSSEEGQMEWVERSRLDTVPVVKDFMELLYVLDNPEITEFQYTQDADGEYRYCIR